MLGQLLVTLLVIVLATLYVRKRAQRERARKTEALTGPADTNPWQQKQPGQTGVDLPDGKDASSPDLRVLLWAALAMTLTLGGTLYYLAWQDARKSVTVILYRDDGNQPVIYEVRKRDLGDRSFVTVDGTRVSVSANERIEIIGL